MAFRLLHAAALVLSASYSNAHAANPDALWKIVSTGCAVNIREKGTPAPCELVDLAHGYIVLKDNSPLKPEHYLIIPTAKVPGIEDPAILAPDAPNYWQAAWDARTMVSGKLNADLPRDAIALAINSTAGRTQNQLHIHVDCVRADVRAVLKRNEASIGVSWTKLGEPIDGHPYRAMRITDADFTKVRPFELLANGIDGAKANMGNQTLAAIGAVFSDGSPGFYLLTDQVDLAAADVASGEDLIDPSCALRSAANG